MESKSLYAQVQIDKEVLSCSKNELLASLMKEQIKEVHKTIAQWCEHRRAEWAEEERRWKARPWYRRAQILLTMKFDQFMRRFVNRWFSRWIDYE